jgi:hypothetical protein
VASLYYFSRDIKEVVYNADNTTVMENATFPLVTIKTGDNKINLLHGYSSNLDANVVRESVTPIGTDQTFEVYINQEDYTIKKMNYELRDFVGNNLIENNSVSVFENSGDEITAKIKFNSELAPGQEYAVKITLITSESQKMYYYERIKIIDNAYLKEKLSFIMDFHNAIKNKNTAEKITQYLEPDGNADSSSLAYVNINSSFDLITWGNLKPEFLTDVIPMVKEIYNDTASVELSYFIEADVSGIKEKYQVTEFYRVRYSASRMYLLNYERRMEALFDPNLASISKSEFKLGISGDDNLPYLVSDDQKKLAFVRNQDLWFYDLDKNEMVQVFSFRQEKTDYIRDQYDQHDIRLLSMDAEGNVDFLVYGYMNRGQYEGKVAVILYRFVRSENRIEELVYIPVEETYQTLKENLGNFTYVNSKEVFFFHINNTIYSYNLVTKELVQIATNIHQNGIVVLKDQKYVIWQANSDLKLSKNICLMNLETGDIQTISSKTGYNIRLLGMIDSNIIYGYVRENDILSMVDGKVIAPLSEIEIASPEKEVLKSYKKAGYYISSVKVNDNVVTLNRVRKENSGGSFSYVPASDDFIMNQVKTNTELIKVNTRVTDKALTELYMTLPDGVIINAVPKITKPVLTVIAQDPTVRLEDTKQDTVYYYPYVSGGIKGAYTDAADAVNIARDNIGVVLDSDNRLVWEKGVKSTQHTITDMATLSWSPATGNSVENGLDLMLTYQGLRLNKTKLSLNNRSAYDVLLENSRYTPIRLTGITLDDALYYVSENRPVLAVKGDQKAVLIYGYDTFNIMTIDPSTGYKSKMGIQDSTNMFKEAGNVFLSYLGQ